MISDSDLLAASVDKFLLETKKSRELLEAHGCTKFQAIFLIHLQSLVNAVNSIEITTEEDDDSTPRWQA